MTTEPRILRPAPSDRRRALHADTIGKGPRLVLAHGFTQTGRVWGSMDADLAADHQVVAGRPARARRLVRGGRRPGRRRRRCWATPVGGPPTSATRWGPGSASTWPWHRPDLVDGLVLISGTAGIDDEDERRQRRRVRRRAGRAARSRRRPERQPMPVESFVRRWLDNPMFAGISAGGRRPRGAAAQHRSRPGLQPPAGRHRHPAAAVGIARPADHAGADRHRGPRREVHRPRTADGRGHRAQRPHVVVAGAGHAPHLQRPDDGGRSGPGPTAGRPGG